MKKLLIIILIVLLMAAFNFLQAKFMLSVSGNLLFPADSGFKDIYGDSQFYPEFKARYLILAGFYVWGSYGFFSKTGTTPVLQEETKTTQNFLTVGAGYLASIAKKLDFTAELGLLYGTYKEEALGEEVDGSATGFAVELGILYKIIPKVFVEFFIGYGSASDTVENVEIKLGGTKAGLGLGVRF